LLEELLLDEPLLLDDDLVPLDLDDEELGLE
jgi:hypothetical protein